MNLKNNNKLGVTRWPVKYVNKSLGGLWLLSTNKQSILEVKWNRQSTKNDNSLQPQSTEPTDRRSIAARKLKALRHNHPKAFISINQSSSILKGRVSTAASETTSTWETSRGSDAPFPLRVHRDSFMGEEEAPPDQLWRRRRGDEASPEGSALLPAWKQVHERSQ